MSGRKRPLTRRLKPKNVIGSHLTAHFSPSNDHPVGNTSKKVQKAQKRMKILKIFCLLK